MKATNLTQTQVRTIKADLLDQNIIREVMYGKSLFIKNNLKSKEIKK
jgi:hypothetical protein